MYTFCIHFVVPLLCSLLKLADAGCAALLYALIKVWRWREGAANVWSLRQFSVFTRKWAWRLEHMRDITQFTYVDYKCERWARACGVPGRHGILCARVVEVEWLKSGFWPRASGRFTLRICTPARLFNCWTGRGGGGCGFISAYILCVPIPYHGYMYSI